LYSTAETAEEMEEIVVREKNNRTLDKFVEQ
jgi:hypothetical protein